MAAQPLKIVRVAIEPTVLIGLEKILVLAVTLVNTSHSALAKILQVFPLAIREPQSLDCLHLVYGHLRPG